MKFPNTQQHWMYPGEPDMVSAVASFPDKLDCKESETAVQEWTEASGSWGPLFPSRLIRLGKQWRISRDFSMVNSLYSGIKFWSSWLVAHHSVHSESINSSLGTACLDGSSVDGDAFPGCGIFLAAVLSIYKHIYWVLWVVGKVKESNSYVPGLEKNRYHVWWYLSPTQVNEKVCSLTSYTNCMSTGEIFCGFLQTDW